MAGGAAGPSGAAAAADAPGPAAAGAGAGVAVAALEAPLPPHWQPMAPGEKLRVVVLPVNGKREVRGSDGGPVGSYQAPVDTWHGAAWPTSPGSPRCIPLVCRCVPKVPNKPCASSTALPPSPTLHPWACSK